MINIRLMDEDHDFLASGRIPEMTETSAILVYDNRYFVYVSTDDEGVDVYSETVPVEVSITSTL